MQREDLQQFLEQKILLDIRRDDFNEADVRGYIVDMSENLALVAKMTNFKFDGFTILQIEDITFVRWGHDQLKAWHPASTDLMGPRSLQGVTLPSKISILTWWCLLESLQTFSGLVTIHRDRRDDKTCYILRDIELHLETVTGTQVTVEGKADGSVGMLVNDITSIDILGDYELGLAAALAARQSA